MSDRCPFCMKMSSVTLKSRLQGYRRLAAHEFNMWRAAREDAAIRKRYDRWVRRMYASPPDVIAGVDFEFGGVRNHLRAIKRYSDLNVALVPDERAMGGLSRFRHHERMRFVNEFVPARAPVVHSHVMPWIIHWSRRQQKRGLRWVHTYHLHYFPEHAPDGLLPWQLEVNDALTGVAPQADVRISVALWQQKFLAEACGIESVYVPNGVDVVRCDAADARAFARMFGFDKFVLYVGRNDPVKNPCDFVRLAGLIPDVRFVMIGGGLTAATLQHEWGMSIPRNLSVLGSLPSARVQEALAASSCVVVTSHREGLPTLVLEAMAHAKPIVVPREQGCVEAVNGEDCGYIYEPGDLGDLVRQTIAALDDRERSARARPRVLRVYDWRVIAPVLDSIYLGAPGPPVELFE